MEPTRPVIPVSLPDIVVGYASGPGADCTQPIVLRRLAVLNWACGLLMVGEFPLAFLGIFLGLRHTEPLHGRPPPTVAFFWHNVRQALPDMSAGIEFTVACGLAALVNAWLINQRRGRWFGILAGYSMLLAFPFGTLAGLPTATILWRRQTRVAYRTRRLERP